jgi:hypothetical protein
MNGRIGALMLIGVLAMPSMLNAQSIRIPEDCREILPAEVTVHLKPEGRGDAAVRSALRTAASVEAIQQTSGTRVRNRAAIDLQSERSSGSPAKSESRFTQRMTSQASGLVSLQVLDETVQSDSASLHGKAVVCIPRDSAMLKETISVVGFLSSRGEPLEDGVSALRSIFSASRAFALSDDVEETDWLVDGRIDSVDVRDATVNNVSLSGKPSIAGSNGPANFKRLQVTGRIEAKSSDGHRIAVAFDETRNVAEGVSPTDVLNQWVPELLRKSSGDLEARLVADRGGAAPSTQQHKGPTW